MALVREESALLTLEWNEGWLAADHQGPLPMGGLGMVGTSVSLIPPALRTGDV